LSTRNYIYSFASSGYSFLMVFGTTALISRWLTPTEIGVYSLGFAFIALLNAFKNFGIQNYIVVNEELNEEKIKSATLVALILSWSIGLLLLLCRNYIAEFYQQTALLDILIVQSVAFFLWPFTAIRSGILQRKMDFKTIFWIDLVAKTISSLVTLYFAYYQHGAISLAYGAASLTVSSFVLLAITVKAPWLFSIKYLKDCMSFGGITSVIALVSLFSSQGLVLLLGKLITIESVAQFERTQTIPILYWSYLYPAMAAVLLPSFANILRNEKKAVARKNMLRSWIFIAMVSIPVFILLGGTSYAIILLLYGQQWQLASDYVYLFCIASGMSSLFITGQSILYAARKMSQVLFTQVMSKLVLIGGIVFSTNITLEVIGLAFIASNLVFSLLITIQVTKFLNLTVRHFKMFVKKLLIFALPFLLILVFYKLIQFNFAFNSLYLMFCFGLTTLSFWLFYADVHKHPIIHVLKKLISKE